MKVQFRIITLLLIVTIVAVIVSFFGRQRLAASGERNAIEELGKGCRVAAYFDGDKQLADLKLRPFDFYPARCKKLYLIGNGNADKLPSLHLLKRFNELEKLCFRRFIQTNADLEFVLNDDDFQVIASLDSLQALEISQVKMTEINFDCFAKIPDLQELIIGGKISNGELEKLRSCQKLESLNIESAQIEFDANDDTLPFLEQLNLVTTGANRMDLDVFSKYQDNGTRVIHEGIDGCYLEKNFLHIGNTYAKINLETSYITGTLNLDSDTIEWMVFAGSNDNIIHYGWDWTFQSMPFSTPGCVAEFECYRDIALETYYDPTGHFYDGIFQGAEASEFQLSGFQNGTIHLRWVCQLEFDSPFELDASLPVKLFAVTSGNGHSKKLATYGLERVFDSESFSESQRQPHRKGQPVSYVFTRK